MKNILIVESGAKAKTLQRYLGKGWSVVATGGHVETLPFDRRLHGKDAKKAFWASRNGSLPAPPWVWTDRGEEAVREIVKAADDDGDVAFWVATDPDREGEFIAWCLERHLGGRGPLRRVAFQEVTREALEAALERPRDVDEAMVESALVRKFLDRLVGYRTSKMADAIVPGGKASMGRVQTPTLGFVVDRELEREAHVPIPYFEVRARAEGVDFEVRFHEPDDPAAWRGDDGKVDPTRTSDRDLADRACDALRYASTLRLTAAEPSTRSRRPAPPFTTDALLQAAGSRFGWSPRKTSALASMLYEAGHVTYIRTDSTRLAAAAIDRARDVIVEAWGADHLGTGARAEPATGPVQDAHEAIRPSRLEVEEPDDVEEADARRLYRLIRARTLASRMAPSVRQVVSLEAECDRLDRPLTGSVSWRTFAGWEAAYAEFLGDVAVAPPAVELEAGAAWRLDPSEEEAPNPRLIEDATKPPARFRPHTLIREMKEAGIGRPSTYGSTVDKLEERGYIAIEDGSVVPTERGRVLWLDAAPLYVEEAPEEEEAPEDDADGSGRGMELFSPAFTAAMEEELDRIANGEAPAPAAWELWRDRVRSLHESARAQRDSGEIS
ncbi:MAG: type IA DNA topoisomerase, partial [Gemmatimonadota bacterium]